MTAVCYWLSAAHYFLTAVRRFESVGVRKEKKERKKLDELKKFREALGQKVRMVHA